MKKEDDTLSELRQEYKDVKKELGKYDSFIDNHPFLCIFTPFILSLVMVVVAAVNSLWWVWMAPLVLFIFFIVMLSVALFRSGKIGRINTRLDDIEHEVKLFHSKPLSATGSSGSRDTFSKDELGLWQDVNSDDKHSSKGGWIMGVVVLLVIGAVISYNRTHQTDSSTPASNEATSQQADQASIGQYQCLDDAYNAYNSSWDKADTDGDGKVSYSDGSSTITTNYYDAVISCYRTHKTADSESYIADYQAKRQQEVDSYNAYIQAVGNAAAGARNNSSSGMNCTSNSIGSSTYTRCY